MAIQEAPETLDVQSLLPDGTQPIGGEWVPARGGVTLAVENPATGEILAHVPRNGADDVSDAVAAASDAFPAWRDTSPTRRGQLLLDWAALCREHAAAIDLLERLEVGRSTWGPAPMPGILTFTAGLADKATGVIGAPFGGYKSSGFGRTVSAVSILDYTQVKSVMIDGRD